MKDIVEARKQGPYTSLFDFCYRVDLGQLNKRMLENLVLAGCFDSLGYTRKGALSIMEECVNISLAVKQNECSEQGSLFGEELEEIEEPPIQLRGEFAPRERLLKEKEVLGFFVSESPLDEFRAFLPLLSTYHLEDVSIWEEETYVRVAGIVANLSRRVSRKGDSYARFILEDMGEKSKS